MLRGASQMARQEECESERRRFADFQSVVKRFVTDMRDVHDNPEAVHFTHHIFAEIREAVVHRLVGRRIGPFIVAAVR